MAVRITRSPPLPLRKLAAHPPAEARRARGELAAESRRPLLHPDQPVMRSLASDADPETTGPLVSARRGTRPFASSSPSIVRARGAWRARSRAPLARSCRARAPRWAGAAPGLLACAARRRDRPPRLVDERGNLARRRNRRRHARLVVATEQCHSTTSSCMLRRPTSSADRSASSAASASRRSTCLALVTCSITAARPCPTKSWTSRAIRRRSVRSACSAS